MLWPTRCAICDVPGDILCAKCASALRFVDVCKACPTCGAPYGTYQCSECNDTMLSSLGREKLPMDSMVHCLVLDDKAHRLITIFKDGGEVRLAAVIAQYLARYIRPEWVSEKTYLSYIPATKSALSRRGFDHMQLVLDELAKCINLPIAPIFARPKSSDQRNLNRGERLENMTHSLMLLQGAKIPEICILVDDVCTTGSTLFAATDLLKEAGCSHVYALTFGRVLDS